MPLQTTAPATDFTYAGMFFNADSGLDLTLYRAYDPVAGRWLSRDPLGEASNPVGNLYPYAAGNPVSLTDPDGDIPLLLAAAIGGAVGAGTTDALLQLAQKGRVQWPEVFGAALTGAASHA